MSGARPVRVARSSGPAPEPPGRSGLSVPSPAPSRPVERRPNTAALRRALWLAVLYVFGIAVVYALLAVLARLAPGGTGPGAANELGAFAAIAALLALAGATVALGSAPREVLLSERQTVVVGRFGRRYVFPGRDRLRVTVLRRVPPGWLSSTAVETVEIFGGSTRRTFTVDEGLLPEPAPEDEPAP